MTCDGTINAVRKMMNTTSRPGNLSRAKANAASELMSSDPTTMIVVIFRLLKTWCRNGMSWKTCL